MLVSVIQPRNFVLKRFSIIFYCNAMNALLKTVVSFILVVFGTFGFVSLAAEDNAPGTKSEKPSVNENTEKSTLVTCLRRDSLKTVTFNTTMNVTLKEMNQVANARIRIGGRDSLAMEITAFGIPVAKLFMNKEQFIFLDLFNGRAVKGKSSASNMANVTNIPLSFDDFVCLLRCEAPFPAENYSNEGTTASGSIIFKYDRPDNNREFIALDEKAQNIKQYQRKDKDGTMLMNINYADIEVVESQNLPHKVQVQAPQSNFKLSVESKDWQINTAFKEPFRFRIPSGIETQVID